MRRLLASFARDRRGASAVEFALLVLPFFLLLFALIDIGWLLWTRQAAQQAAVSGARCMGIPMADCSTGSGTYDATKSRTYIAGQAARWGVAITSANITVSHSATCGGQAGFSKVDIAFDRAGLIPGVMTALNGGVTVTATACFPNQAS